MPRTPNGIHYQESGDGEDALVLLPGLGCSVEAWEEVAPLLDGYRVIRMDLPGHAGSREVHADGSSLTTFAAPITEACDQLDLPRFAVVGLSLGGAVAMRVAVDRPHEVSAVMAVMPWPASGTEAGGDPVPETLLSHFGDEEFIQGIAAAISLDVTKTTDLVRTMSTGVTEQFWRSWLSSGIYTSISDELPLLRPPACYLLGGRDVIAPREKLIDEVRAIPGGRAIFRSELGHLAPYEAPVAVADEIRGFLAAARTSRSAPV